QAGQQAEAARIAAEQLQAAVRRELLGNELDRQIPLDHLPQAAYAQAHQRGLRELRDDMGMSALWIRWQAPLIHADLNLTRSACSGSQGLRFASSTCFASILMKPMYSRATSAESMPPPDHWSSPRDTVLGTRLDGRTPECRERSGFTASRSGGQDVMRRSGVE